MYVNDDSTVVITLKQHWISTGKMKMMMSRGPIAENEHLWFLSFSH